jgi:hypothetical protein
MDSNEEMIQQIMDDEASCDDNVREHLAIIACLQKMLDNTAEKNKGPHRGGSKTGRKKSKSWQRLEGHTMLYNDYFFDSVTHADNFWGCYRMSKELLMTLSKYANSLGLQVQSVVARESSPQE